MLSSGAAPVRVHILDCGGVRIQVRSHENTVDFEVVTNNGSVLGSPFQNIPNYLGQLQNKSQSYGIFWFEIMMVFRI